MNKGSADYACVGVGVGPANLSLASLLHPHRGIPNIFLEKRDSFGWYDGQLLPDTTIQVSMLKDLVTLADPTSEFSFLAYLHQEGRLYHYINAQFDAVPRHEYRNYLEWAVRKNQNIAFGEEVRSVDFDGFFIISTSKRVVTAENVSIGIGHRPWVPAFARRHLGRGQFHVNEFTRHTAGLAGKRVCVVGGGQSGAEAFLDLISGSRHEPPRQVVWISRRDNFYPIDDSPFINETYTPGYSDYFAALDAETRKQLNTQRILTSDGISLETLRKIYQRLYESRFIQDRGDQAALYPGCAVTDITASGSEFTLELSSVSHPGITETLRADVVIWATGYRPAPLDLLAPIADRLERSGEEYRIDRHFSVCWDGPHDRNIFILNSALQQRGLADKNLSLIAWRSQRVLDRLRASHSEEPQPAFMKPLLKPSFGTWRWYRS